MPGNQEVVRVHVWVKGRVQGVGFRAHVEYSAGQLGITGWVRNVGYDTVETVAEGEQDKIEQFVKSMKEGPLGARVDETRLEKEPTSGEFQTFTVRRSL